ncbi:uncharacterized protein TRAVEDRAFT_53496 [Trametes versicolor FP-101664 SS1]|uniref:uncharacterized protein n=1 Tax=Trametes versicolor (strain FP-101664) TaxID=717944 RepID=UPI0004622142|nr:uncharacterized protein TRAVEDRAFT_53496 [Trametes versicolor FP-101664 SS1]EIW53080.1 hypothetical protein TRAVEDRAFT_53496 [Trametes versicolor FP-101664 SS1]
MLALASPAPSLGPTFGITLLGTCVGLMLYGMTIHQTYRYFHIYTLDKRILKDTVRVLFLADTIHSVLTVHICYYYLVQSQSDHGMLENGVWSIRTVGVITQLVVTIVQGFYLRRIHILKAHIAIQVVVAISMLGEIVANLVMTVAFTDTLLNTLIAYTINTGLLTCTLSTLCLFFTILQPYNLIYFALNMPITKSYTNSMLTVLNSRRALADRACAATVDLGTFGMTVSPGICMAPLPAPRDAPSIAFRQTSTDDSRFEC